MSRRLLTNLATIIPALLLAACNAPVEEEVVAEPIHIISSFGEAGSSAKTIRILAPKIEAHFQRSVEIHYNEGGKGGDIGARMAANAPADQTTLFVGTVGNIALLPNVLSSYEINPAEDFRAVTHLTATPDVLIANSGLGVSTLDELVAYAMEKGEPLLAMTTAPYVAPMVADGSVVPLAVAHETRLPVYPDVPTMVESGIAIEHGSWSGAFIPAAASAEEAQQMFKALEAALNDAEVIAQLAELGMIAAPSASPEAFANYITEETARLGALAEAHNIREE